MKKYELNTVRGLASAAENSFKWDLMGLCLALICIFAGLLVMVGLIGDESWKQLGYMASVTGLFLLIFAIFHLALVREQLTRLRKAVHDFSWDIQTEETIFENIDNNEQSL